MNTSKRAIFLGVIAILLMLSVIVQLPASSAQSSFSVVSAGQTETTISLEWNAYTPAFGNSIENYIVYVSTVGTNGPYTSYSEGSSTLETFFYDLTPNSNYWFYVEVVQGNVFGSSTATTTTIQVSTVQNINLQSSSVTETTVSLSWTDYNTYSNLTSFQSYTVQISTSSGSWSTLTTINSQTDTSYTVTGLSAGTSYSFQVYDSVLSSGISTPFNSYSNTVSVTTVSPLSVSASSSATSVATGGNIQLTASPTGGEAPYSYQWYVNGNPVSGATSSTFTFSSSTAGTYTVYVKIADSSGTSQDSNTITLTVNSSILPTLSSGSYSRLIVIVPIVIIVAVIAIVVTVMSRRKKKSGKAP